jgi:protein-export membrane protein SecD
VLLEAESSQPVTSDQMDQVRTIIERRVNSLGVAEPLVQRAGQNRIIIELPGVRDPQAAIDLVQQTALLEFVDFTKPPGCTATYPVEGQYILTDRQVALGTSATGQATATVTAAATATTAATAEATLAATSEATAEATLAATAEATTAATTESTAEATIEATTASLPRAMMRPAQGTPEPTTAATPEATAAVTAEATTAATTEATAAATTEASAEATAAATAEVTPEATAAAPGSKANPLVNPCTGQPFRTVMTGAGLSSADAGVRSGSTDYVVDFQLAGNEEAQRFASHTAANVGNPMAIVLDGEILSYPTIQAALTTGGQITGGFTRDQAVGLSVQLRSGALPVSLRIESTEQIGASLGQQSVEASIRAGVIGVIGVFIFLLVFYRWAGLAATLALLLFSGINLALYKYIPVTLTLSAITGFLISIGTAVDGNILVFERVKEELRAGRGLMKAIEIGFDRAWPSIRESNISTILIALVLYFFGGQFGASAVRGFAVTLILGLITNLFTAVIVTRTLLNVIVVLRGDRANQIKLFGE